MLNKELQELGISLKEYVLAESVITHALELGAVRTLVNHSATFSKFIVSFQSVSPYLSVTQHGRQC